MDGKHRSCGSTNPRKNANVFSVLTFLYTLPIFLKGWRKQLTEAEIYETLPDYRSNELGEKFDKLWRDEVDKCKKTKKTPSLRNPLIKAFWFESLISGLALMTLEVIVKPLQCVLIGRLIGASRRNAIEDMYLYAVGVGCCSLAISSLIHPFLLSAHNLGLKLRISCSTLVYRKLLKLKLDVFEKTSSGKILTLVTNDSNRFYEIPITVHFIWVGVLQIIVVTYLLYEEFQISSFFGVCFLVLFVPIYLLLGRVSKGLRAKAVARTDERVRVMKEIIYGIAVIKMYNWERYFSNLISTYRRLEIWSVRFSSFIKGIFASFNLFVQRTSVFLTILAFVLLDNDITAEKAFTLVTFYAALRGTVIFFFPKGVSVLMESAVPIKRLNAFLLCEEIQEKADLPKAADAIALTNVSLQRKDNILTDITFNVKRGTLIAIVGPVGCGKTTLVHVILNELSASSGSLAVSGSCSYASQESWIFTSSVQQNIVFGSELDKERYDKVLDVCSLKHDLKGFPHGDLTVVGDRGAMLSGGQRARINLARAVYRKADIYILDDPLSAVDSRVGQSIFDKCIKSFLSEKTVLLITHQMQYLNAVDKIIVLNNGKIVAKGSFSELMTQNVDFETILQQNEGEELTDSSVDLPNGNKITSAEPLAISPPKVEEEHVESGGVSTAVYKAYFASGKNSILLCLLVILLVVTQVFVSGSDYFIAYWVNAEQVRFQSDSEPQIGVPIQINIYVYSGLIFGVIVFTFATIITLHSLCMNSSIELHKNMFNNVIRAPLRFFHHNHSGRVLNRFSKDIETIDEVLPTVMNETLQLGVSALGIIILMTAVNYYVLLPALIVVTSLYYLRKFYLATSRMLKRLEGTTRSPVLGYINATIQGLSTIRAFDAQGIVLDEFNGHQDLNSSTFYMFVATSRAFGYWTDIFCNIFITCSMFLLLINNDTFGGNIGLTISQSLGLLGIVQFVVRHYAELENGMTSVERVVEYTSLKREQEDEKGALDSPPQNWPKSGQIVFSNVSLRYSPKEPYILKNVNILINPREKIGVVGRTGAGKSSLINALFRLCEFSGSVIIDEVDTKTLKLCHLRNKISIIPQQPTIFSGTVRNNLDPFRNYSNATLWKALEDVELKNLVNDLPSGLDSEISEGGLNYSVGQRQLICLARAMLSNNNIFVLDEATSNVDSQTDLLIQKTVRKTFSDCTVITIAHRLDTVIDCDKILVLDDGVVVEFDHPYVLLQNNNGKFKNMVENLTKSSAEALEITAKMNYENHLQNSKT